MKMHLGEGNSNKSDLEGLPASSGRFKAVKSRLSNERCQLHYVYDQRLQVDVFHWYGRTGSEKCTAIANALNALNHGDE
jgi:hypothetical protein